MTVAQILKKCVAYEVIKDDRTINVQLIGANCTRSLEHIKFISRRNNGLYAMNTVLGWCTVRKITCRNRSERISKNGIFSAEITNT